MTEPAAGHCATCRGPCRVPAWAKDGSWYSNNPGKFDAAVAHAHSWFEEPWLSDTARARAGNLTMVRGGYPCRECGKHAFPDEGTVCYWCRKDPLRAAGG